MLIGFTDLGILAYKEKERKPRDQRTAWILDQGAGSVENIWEMEGDEPLNMIINMIINMTLN